MSAMYEIEFSKEAAKHVLLLRKSSPQLFKKLERLLDMQIITTREFRANQKKYFELAEKETIFVSRRNAAPIVVYAATEEDFPSREELEAIQRGIEDIKQGRTFKMRKDESLDDFLNRIEDECNV